MAPDAATAKRGEALAASRAWKNLGVSENALWGACKKSGDNGFYQTWIDRSTPAFKCNCPSRKFPCKHSIALLLIFVRTPEMIGAAKEIPSGISAWIESRKAKSTENAGGIVKNAGQAKTRNKRLTKMAAGFEDLDRWMGDLIRQGLASTESQPVDFWQNIASRMVDAQIGGVARMLRAMPLLQASNPHWPEQMLAQIAQFHLLSKGFEKLEQLPEPLQADLLTVAGVNVKKDDLMVLKGVVDRWIVLGIIEGVDENLNFRRTWLYGEKTQKTALILEFSFGSEGYSSHWITGQCFEAEIAFYPSAFPLRAVVKEHLGNAAPPQKIIGYDTFESFFENYSRAVAANPWLFDFPCLLEGVTPVFQNQQLFLVDKTSRKIPAQSKGIKGWKMLALSGGNPIATFGEWSGGMFVPLSVVPSGNRIIAL